MHIPDGYLSPSTCAAFGAAMVPVWAVAARKLKAKLLSRQVPLMAMGSAFSFVIMMYNVPVAGGTSAHAVGGALLAVVLGPWAAVICVTIALAIQALLFGDGGVLTFGANCFDMAFVLPFTAWAVYRFVSGGSGLKSRRRWVGAALGGFLGLNVAALTAGLALGVQPALFHTADGTPLYCPYPLTVTIPAMLAAHLLLAGPLEGVVTALVVRYLQAADPALLAPLSPAGAALAGEPAPGLRRQRLWWVLGVLVVLSPLGLLARGTAFGEWSAGELRRLIGFVPAGMARLANAWTHAPLPGYSLPRLGEGGWGAAVVYIVSAALGVGLIVLLMHLLRRVQRASREDGT